MKINFVPKTRLGKWSVGLIIAMPILFFVGMFLANSLYAFVSAGDTILIDLVKRPALALAMLAGMTSGILAFILGTISIVRQKERALLVYLATFIGLLLLLFLSGEITSPH